MFEPLTKITIPDENARLRAFRTDQSAERQIIILTQAYTNVLSQENLSLVASRLMEHGEVRLITVEGSKGKLERSERPASRDYTIENLIKAHTQVSAGIRHLMATSILEFEVWGVDEPNLIFSQQSAMLQIESLKDIREKIFGAFRKLLEKTQKKFYTQEMRKLSHISFPFYKVEVDLIDQTSFLRETAQKLGLELDAYPAISATLEIAKLDKDMNKKAIERQREVLITMVVEKAMGWWQLTGPNIVTFDLEKGEPVIAYWLKKVGKTEQDLEDEIAQRGEEAVFLECKEWLEKWLKKTAHDASSGKIPSHHFFEDLILLALRLDIDVFRFRELREYIYKLRKAALIETTDLEREIMDCSQVLLDELCTTETQRGIVEIEREIDILYKAYRLELAPEHLDQFGSAGSLLELQSELAKILGKEPLDLGITDQFENAKDKAFDFYKLTKQRSQFMIERTLEIMRNKNEDRAILVCGGFHERVIRMHLETRHADVSWSVIDPMPEL